MLSDPAQRSKTAAHKIPFQDPGGPYGWRVKDGGIFSQPLLDV